MSATEKDIQFAAMIDRLDMAALKGRTVTEGHAAYCRVHGHATHHVNGVDQGICPRCGELYS